MRRVQTKPRVSSVTVCQFDDEVGSICMMISTGRLPGCVTRRAAVRVAGGKAAQSEPTTTRGAVGADPARDRAWARGVSHNRNPARATRIAEISTLRLYCPLLNNNTPLPVAVEANPPATLWLVGNKKPTRCELAGFRTRFLSNPGSGASQPSL